MLTLILFLIEAIEEECGDDLKSKLENDLREILRKLPLDLISSAVPLASGLLVCRDFAIRQIATEPCCHAKSLVKHQERGDAANVALDGRLAEASRPERDLIATKGRDGL
jgi:hypothetical protein